MFLAHKNKLPNDRIRIQYSDLDLPGLIRSHPAIALVIGVMVTMKRTVQEDDYWTAGRI
jgi:hypothetical protein